MKKMFLISETISFPFDEGVKNIVLHITECFTKEHNFKVVTKTGNNTGILSVTQLKLNKFFFNRRLKGLLKKFSPDAILYIPEASCTFNSFIRAKILKLMCRDSKIVMLGVQHREYSFFHRMLLGFLRPDLLFLLSKSDKTFFEKKGIKVKVLSPAIDKEKFCEVDVETKIMLRKKYGIPVDDTIVTHIGHVKVSRNLECFIEVQKIDNIQVIIVGSTTTQIDKKLKQLLKEKEIIVINDYLPEIQEIYQLSDIYVFPVLRQNAAIEMPLSVLEAMACNLSVVTTRFGGLVDYFKEDGSFKYFDFGEDLIRLIKSIDIEKVQNRKKIVRFTWGNFANEVISACERLI